MRCNFFKKLFKWIGNLFTRVYHALSGFIRDVWEAIEPIIKIIAAVIFIICIIVLSFFCPPAGMTLYYLIAATVISGIIGFSTLVDWIGSAIAFIVEEIIAVIGAVLAGVGASLLSSPWGIALIGVGLYLLLRPSAEERAVERQIKAEDRRAASRRSSSEGERIRRPRYDEEYQEDYYHERPHFKGSYS